MSGPQTASRRLVIAGRTVLGLLLLGAGILKANEGAAGAEALANYRLFPAQVNQVLAVLLPWWEWATGILLLAGLWLRTCTRFAALLFMCFTLVLGSALLRGLDIECGCFGSGFEWKVGMPHLLANAALFLLSGWLARRSCLPDQGTT